jgi:hypothetical protein
MRVVLTAGVLFGMVLVGHAARAQPAPPTSQAAPSAVVPPSATSISPEQEQVAFETYATGQLQKWIGISLTIVGVVGLAGSGMVVSPVFGSDVDIALGVVGGILSLTCIAVGIPLLVVGSARQSRAVRLGYRPVAAAPMVAPVRGGLTAGVRLLSF